MPFSAPPASSVAPKAISATTTAVAGDVLNCDTSAGAFSVPLPLTPGNGDTVTLFDAKGTWRTNNLTVVRNGESIDGSAADLVCNFKATRLQLV